MMANMLASPKALAIIGFCFQRRECNSFERELLIKIDGFRGNGNT
jgi:hypothetical protein